MKALSDGGPAFPIPDPRLLSPPQGMSLRDYFAAQALIGLMAEPIVGTSPATAFDITRGENTVDTYAISAYKLADAMLAARETT